MIKVYFDGKCGLCTKEINYYKKISPPNLFQWCDIFEHQSDLESIGVTTLDALMFLHAVDENRALYKGVDAFALIWINLDKWRVLAFIVSLPGVRMMFSLMYKIFAKWRFKRMDYCHLKQ